MMKMCLSAFNMVVSHIYKLSNYFAYEFQHFSLIIFSGFMIKIIETQATENTSNLATKASFRFRVTKQTSQVYT